jgi:hypothetical protein
MLLDVRHQSAAACPFVVPCTRVVHSAEPPLPRVGPRTRRRPPAHRNTGGAGPPLVDGLRLMHTVIIRDHREARNLWSRGGSLEPGQARPTSPLVCMRPAAREQLPSGAMQGSSPIVLLMLAWRHACSLGAWRPPRCPALGQQVHSACIRNDHQRMGLPRCVVEPQTGQPRAPVWSILLSHPLGPLPPPAERMEPAAARCRRHRDAMLGLERRRAWRTTPARAAPTVRTRRCCESGAPGARQPRQQYTRLDRDRARTVWINTAAEAPRARRTPAPVHTGACAQHERGHLRRVSACGTPQEARARQQRARPRATAYGTHLDVLCRGDLQEGG